MAEFVDLQNDTILNAFKEADRAQVKKWVNLAAASLWIAEEWTFRYAEDSVVLTAASTALTEIADDYGIALGLWNSDGDQLTRVSRPDWNSLFHGSTETGTPWAYTLLDGAIKVGPIPDAADTLLLHYQRAYGHLSGSTFVAGAMDSDGDVPASPDDFHYVIVHWARMVGKALRSDPTAKLEEALRDEGLEAMRRTYLVEFRGEPDQWGAYTPGYW